MLNESLLKKQFIGRDGFIWWIGQVCEAGTWAENAPALPVANISDLPGFKRRVKVSILFLVKKFEYTNTDKKQDGYEKILKYNVNSNIDLQEKLVIGAYNNRTLFFDPFEFKVKEVDFDISKQKDKVKSSGKEIDFVAEEFRNGS